VCQCILRRFAPLPQNLLKQEWIYLVNDTIYVIWKRRPLYAHTLKKLDQTICTVCAVIVLGVNRKTKGCEPSQHLLLCVARSGHLCLENTRNCFLKQRGLCRDGSTLNLSPTIGKKTKHPFCGNPGIQLPQTASSCIARIHESFFATTKLIMIQLLEIPPVHQYFTANLKHARSIGRQLQRNGFNRTHIRRYVFPNGAISPCGGGDKPTIHISEAHG